MTFTFSFLDIGQFTAARTLLVEATAYILLSIILSEAIDLWDSRRLSRGKRIKLTGLTTRKVLKTIVDILLILAAVTSELRTDVVLVRNGTSDTSLLENQQALANAITSTNNGSEPLLRKLDRSLTGRVGVCEWRTTVVDSEEHLSVFKGEGYATAVKLADSFLAGVEKKPKTYCGAQQTESIVQYEIGDDSILVEQGNVSISNFVWNSAARLQEKGDTKTASAAMQFTIRNRTLSGNADLMCTAYVGRRSEDNLNVNRESLFDGLRERKVRYLQCAGVLRDGEFAENGYQNIIMLHLSSDTEFPTNDSARTENFLTLQTNQNMEVAEIYVASRSITPGFLTYERKLRRGVTVVMADRLAQDIVEGTFQVCGGGCEGFDVITSSKLAAETDFLIEIVLTILVAVAGLATLVALMYHKRYGSLPVMSPVERILAAHLGGRDGASKKDRLAAAQYMSIYQMDDRSSDASGSDSKSCGFDGERKAGCDVCCEIGPL